MEDFGVRFLAFEIILFPLSLILFQSSLVMALTSSSSHLCEMNDVAR